MVSKLHRIDTAVASPNERLADSSVARTLQTLYPEINSSVAPWADLGSPSLEQWPSCSRSHSKQHTRRSNGVPANEQRIDAAHASVSAARCPPKVLIADAATAAR
jgi:hypothetical protein